MNPTDIIKAVAELDGRFCREEGWSSRVCELGTKCCIEKHNYLTSRDAIVPVIEKYKGTKIQDYKFEDLFAGAIQKVTDDFYTVVDILCLTAAQLCEVTLRATGKWVE